MVLRSAMEIFILSLRPDSAFSCSAAQTDGTVALMYNLFLINLSARCIPTHCLLAATAELHPIRLSYGNMCIILVVDVPGSLHRKNTKIQNSNLRPRTFRFREFENSEFQGFRLGTNRDNDRPMLTRLNRIKAKRHSINHSEFPRNA